MNNDNKNIENEKDNLENNNKEKDLLKALTFLFDKETEDISIESKKEFLLKKLPENIVNTAISIYPRINNIILEKNKNNNDPKILFSTIFDIGIITSSLLTSLFINYLLDIMRDKKNQIFLNNFEKTLSENFENKLNEYKEENKIEFNNYVKIENLDEYMNNFLDKYSQNKGLTVNPSLAKIKNDINTIQNNLININTKIENNNFELKNSFKNEIKNILNDYFNNKNINENNIIINENDECLNLIKKFNKDELNNLIFHFEKILNDTTIKINIQNENFKNYDINLLTNLFLKSGLNYKENSKNIFLLNNEENNKLLLQKSLNLLKKFLNSQ